MNTFTIARVDASRFATNTYLVVDQATSQAAVVDPGNWTQNIIDDAAAAGAKITMIIATHGHWDHVEGILPLRKETGAAVYIHREDAPMLVDEKLSLAKDFTLHPEIPGAPDVELEDGDVLELGETKMQVMHTPGHTPGGICLLLGDTMLAGDTLFRRSCGRTDLPGGDWEALQASLSRLAALPLDYTVFCGHGPGTTLEAERQANPYIPKKEQ